MKRTTRKLYQIRTIHLLKNNWISIRLKSLLFGELQQACLKTSYQNCSPKLRHGLLISMFTRLFEEYSKRGLRILIRKKHWTGQQWRVFLGQLFSMKDMECVFPAKTSRGVLFRIGTPWSAINSAMSKSIRSWKQSPKTLGLLTVILVSMVSLASNMDSPLPTQTS
jgi:hypothetical protein